MDDKEELLELLIHKYLSGKLKEVSGEKSLCDRLGKKEPEAEVEILEIETEPLEDEDSEMGQEIVDEEYQPYTEEDEPKESLMDRIKRLKKDK